MTKYYGKIGYGESVESPAGSGVWKDVITERTAIGDVLTHSVQSDNSQKVVPDITIQNSISIIADEFALSHVSNMRYFTWMGMYWSVSEVKVQHPRLVLRPGGVYNGPKV